MEFLTFLTNLFLQTVASDGFKSGMAYIGIGLCCLAPAFCCIGEGVIGMKAVEAVGRQPEAASKITRTMIIAQAITETGALYGFIMALMLLGK